VGGDVVGQFICCNDLAKGEAVKVPLKRNGYFEYASPERKGVF
jgi:hypothetical protein